MPTKRRSRGRLPQHGHSDTVILYLRTGERRGSKLLDIYIRDLGKDWRDLRDELLAEWTVAHPGTRPFGWWRYDAPEPLGEDESEAEYLTRHSLLGADERRRLGAQASPTEAV